jgi:hypothetical protein
MECINIKPVNGWFYTLGITLLQSSSKSLVSERLARSFARMVFGKRLHMKRRVVGGVAEVCTDRAGAARQAAVVQAVARGSGM